MSTTLAGHLAYVQINHKPLHKPIFIVTLNGNDAFLFHWETTVEMESHALFQKMQMPYIALVNFNKYLIKKVIYIAFMLMFFANL